METLTAETAIQLPLLTADDLIQEFKTNLHKYSFKDLFSVLEHEISLIAKVIIRAAIHTKESQKPFILTIDKATNKVKQIENTRRKNLVRRTFKKWGLFAIHEITKVYPGYQDEMLPADLLIKNSKKKPGKKKAKVDFRSRQLDKLAELYHITDDNTPEFNKICERIAAFTIAKEKKRLIVLTVFLGGETYAYPFSWNTAEKVVKDFHALANAPGMTHEKLHAFRKIPYQVKSITPKRQLIKK